MIKNCTKVTEALPFTALLPFQGNLKASKDDEIKRLADSLLDKGQKTPFFVWQHDNANFVIDGHRRLLAIQLIATVHPEVLQQEYPVVYVIAETVEEAKDSLLEMCSTYGKITPKGLQTFLVDAPNIKIDQLALKVKMPQTRIARPKLQNDHKVFRIRVHKDKAQAVMKILMESGVEVL